MKHGPLEQKSSVLPLIYADTVVTNVNYSTNTPKPRVLFNPYQTNHVFDILATFSFTKKLVFHLLANSCIDKEEQIEKRAAAEGTVKDKSTRTIPKLTVNECDSRLDRGLVQSFSNPF